MGPMRDPGVPVASRLPRRRLYAVGIAASLFVGVLCA